MPPNPPAGWSVPQWLQVAFLIVLVATPFLSIFLNYWLKDRHAAKASDGQALVDDQHSFIDKILKAAEMAPVLMEKNEKLIDANAELRGDIRSLQQRIKELETKVQQLESDRDHWRDMALKIPSLEGQLQTYEKVLRDKEQELNSLRVERDEARLTLSSIVNTH